MLSAGRCSCWWAYVVYDPLALDMPLPAGIGKGSLSSGKIYAFPGNSALDQGGEEEHKERSSEDRVQSTEEVCYEKTFVPLVLLFFTALPFPHKKPLSLK